MDLATESLGCEPKLPRTYTCWPTSKNVGLFAFADTFPSVFRGFRLSDFPRVGTALGQVPMICRQTCRILAPNSRPSGSLLGNGVIRRLRSVAEWEANTEFQFFQVRLRMGSGSWRSRIQGNRMSVEIGLSVALSEAQSSPNSREMEFHWTFATELGHGIYARL